MMAMMMILSIVDDDDDNQKYHLISLESKPIIQSSKSKQECFQLDKWHGGKTGNSLHFVSVMVDVGILILSLLFIFSS